MHHQQFISTSSAHHQHIISASPVHHQRIISASSAHHQCIISASQDHTRPDQIRSDQIRLEQRRLPSRGPNSKTCVLVNLGIIQWTFTCDHYWSSRHPVTVPLKIIQHKLAPEQGICFNKKRKAEFVLQLKIDIWFQNYIFLFTFFGIGERSISPDWGLARAQGIIHWDHCTLTHHSTLENHNHH